MLATSRRWGFLPYCALLSALAYPANGGEIDLSGLFIGEQRIQQNQIRENDYSLAEIRLAGLRMFTNPFTKDEGFGDGNDFPPSAQLGSNHEGNRGTIQNNGTFQRINGLDAQTCLECHSVISRRTVPMRFGIGGAGGVNNSALGAGGATFVDLDLSFSTPETNVNGRVINPPFLFGTGAVELLAKEMTIHLNELRQSILGEPNTSVDLIAKGVSFGALHTDISGTIVVGGDGNAVDVEGLFDPRPYLDGGEENPDFLVVAPFGRKGDQKTIRTLDTGALSFHMGMAVDNGVDHDDDGVVDEVTEGELSALSIFVATMQTPFQAGLGSKARQGFALMNEVGCFSCHRPVLDTEQTSLPFSSPEIGNEPLANVFYHVDLTNSPMNFEINDQGGVAVPLFADLKRHHMGPTLAEFNGDDLFTTAKLWGVADTAPYLHDGRALTLLDAIEIHGEDPLSEAHEAVQAFNSLGERDQDLIIRFLDTLRSPDGTNDDLDAIARKMSRQKD